MSTEREDWQGGRDQIRHTLSDADLSDVWLRCKVQQLLDQADELQAELQAAQEQRAFWRTVAEDTQRELQAAQERVKELEDAAYIAKHEGRFKPLHDALAAQRTEEAGG